MQMECAAAVVEVLATERAQPQRMRVMDDRVVAIQQAQPRFTPPIAQIAVLGGGERKGDVEATDATEGLRRESEIRRDEEPPLGLVDVEVLVQELDEELTGRRIQSLAECVLDAAADGAPRMA